MKKKNRLKKNHEIASIVKQKKRLTSQYYIVYYHPNQDNICKVCISVSKKYGNAVERNYAKRVVREIISPMLEIVKSFNFVIVVKPQAKLEKYASLSVSLTRLLNLIKEKNNGGNK